MRIVVGVDGSAPSTRALEWADAFAQRCGGELVAHTTWTYPAAFDVPLDVLSPSEMNAQALGSLTEAVVAVGLEPDGIDLSVAEAPAGPGLIREAQQRGADLIVVGTRSHGVIKRAFLGSVSRYLASRSPVPVVVVPEEAPIEFDPQPVVVGVDGSENSVAALQWAVDQDFDNIDAVHAWDVTYFFNTPMLPIDMFEQTAKVLLADAVDEVDDDRPGRIQPVMRRGDARPVLMKRARSAALVVLGHRGRSALGAAILGSVAHYLASHSPAAVVVVPDPSEESDT